MQLNTIGSEGFFMFPFTFLFMKKVCKTGYSSHDNSNYLTEHKNFSPLIDFVFNGYTIVS